GVESVGIAAEVVAKIAVFHPDGGDSHGHVFQAVVDVEHRTFAAVLVDAERNAGALLAKLGALRNRVDHAATTDRAVENGLWSFHHLDALESETVRVTRDRA